MTNPESGAANPVSPCILVYLPKERARPFIKNAFPRKAANVITVKSQAEFDKEIRKTLIDAVIVDVVNPTDETWAIAATLPDFPSIPYYALSQSRTADADVIARATELGFADTLTEMLDEEAANAIVQSQAYTARFARALAEPPAQLGLSSETQLQTWANIVKLGGRPVTTKELADSIGITREHLSRHFSQGNGPNLKRIIDLVRLLSAAELSKNPGYDVRDVAAVLGFASSSHLAVTTQRIASTRPASLSGLRAMDIIDRFTQGRTRSRLQLES